MFSKIDKLRDGRPTIRRILDAISDFCDKMLVINYIICFTFSAIVICVPTIISFFCLSEDVRVLISPIIGGVLSLLVTPLLINHIKRKQKRKDELYEINKPLYQNLSVILIQLLADEYVVHGKNVRDEMNISTNDDKVREIVAPLKKFINENYDKRCNTFSVSLIWNIIDVYNECLHSVTKYINIRVKVQKCFRNMRRDSDAKGSFYINQAVINMYWPDDENK